MIPLIQDNREKIAELCRQYGVRRLDVFGSAATGAFDSVKSDIDFIVDLGEYDSTVGARYLDLAVALEALLGYRVDLVTEPSIRDPYFRASISTQRETVYDAGNRKAVA